MILVKSQLHLLIDVLFDPARSAEPPKKEGRFLAIAFKTSPDEARVARLFPSSYTGISLSSLAGNSLINCLLRILYLTQEIHFYN